MRSATEFEPQEQNRIQSWLPRRLEVEIKEYGTKTARNYGSVFKTIDIEKIDWSVSRNLFRAGGYCKSELGATHQHSIVVSYPAFQCWGWEQIKDIVRHELAHAVVHEKHGTDVDSHGQEFRTVAKQIDAPLHGEEPLPFRYELYCSACKSMVDGLYKRSSRTRHPTQYRTDCCGATLEVTEKYPEYARK